MTYTKLNIPVEVIRGREKGPVLFVSAAIHGDEINGTEIIRRLVRREILKNKGTLIVIPVVNILGLTINRDIFQIGERPEPVLPR